jgi:hypothetical protein
MLASSIMQTANASFYFSLTNAQYYNSTSFTGFVSNGYTLGADNVAHYNYSGRSYTSFAWKGNGTSSAVTNNDGNTTSLVDANPEGGFSMARATFAGIGKTVGHGLDSAPEFFFMKGMGPSSFYGWHHGMGNAYQQLQASNASDVAYNNLASTSTTSRFDASSSNDTYIFYNWHSVEGYSKISDYTGNGSTQSINLGFEPRFVWLIPNGQHNIYFTSLHKDSNGFSKWIYPNITDTIYSGVHIGNGIKLTSTGFDIGNSSLVNDTNRSYYYLAFA